MTNLNYRKKSYRKVAMLKNNNFIETFIPSVGLFSRFIITNLLLLIVPTYLISFMLIILSYQESYFLIPVVILLAFISLVVLLMILIGEFGVKRLCINNQEIYLVCELLGVRFLVPFTIRSRQDIIRIERNQDAWNRYFLTIWAGRQKYEIFTDDLHFFSVTNPELDWLAQELSNWLDLPISNHN
ncbi:hypothetical protein ACF3DV_16745 [Chlorogloeopsis fritschii PCC 9212]|uniref:hypothetical protein n=1 Tax=Chlorogloeopsis fritschii TaxID=1124 RepID=UPI001F352653|nr:hypothetical protein [Chlorogloeopsis fritschii]